MSKPEDGNGSNGSSTATFLGNNRGLVGLAVGAATLLVGPNLAESLVKRMDEQDKSNTNASMADLDARVRSVESTAARLESWMNERIIKGEERTYMIGVHEGWIRAQEGKKSE